MCTEPAQVVDVAGRLEAPRQVDDGIGAGEGGPQSVRRIICCEIDAVPGRAVIRRAMLGRAPGDAHDVV
jgi:hypothetical protein